MEIQPQKHILMEFSINIITWFGGVASAATSDGAAVKAPSGDIGSILDKFATSKR